MKDTLRFIAYSDIHHDEHAARCLKLSDTLSIEQQVHRRAIDGNFDFTVFCGDRFLKREPHDEVKVQADRALTAALSVPHPEQPQGWRPHYHLIGNHDWVDNSRKWHTSESLKDVFNMILLDIPGPTLSAYLPLTVHALPSGFEFNPDHFKPNLGLDSKFKNVKRFDLFLFHDMVKGSTSNDEGTHTFSSGIDLHDIDLPGFDLVLAGDVHVPQKFNFKNTKGGYVGAVLQRTRADANKFRGWMEVTATWTGTEWVTQTEMVGTRNFFSRYDIQVDKDSTFENLGIDDVWIPDQAVEVKLTGAKEDVDRVADDPRWSNYPDLLNSRAIDVLRDYKSEKDHKVVDMSASHSVVDDFYLYLESGFSEVGTLDKDMLTQLLEEARR